MSTEPTVGRRFRAGLVTVTVVMACAGEPARTPPVARDTAPTGDPAELDVETALSLAAMPLACIDRPHAPPSNRPGYLDERSFTRRSDYETTRAFYGCWDWHSAVNSTWALVKILKLFPDISVGPLIREKLRQHLTEDALAGELAFFEASPTFERPYGYAWLMELHRELLTWDDDDARTWAPRLAPLTTLFSNRMVTFLDASDYPSRVGTHGNTAFAFSMMIDFARQAGHTELERRIEDAGGRFYREDRGCPTAYEPGRSDFLSPCLEEARFMTKVLTAGEFPAWLDAFLPDPDTDEFQTLARTAVMTADSAQISETDLRGAQSHLIGLAFSRAEALRVIAGALPGNDRRLHAYHTIAANQGQAGFDAMFDADYEGSHWIGTFALRFLTAGERGSRAAGQRGSRQLGSKAAR